MNETDLVFIAPSKAYADEYIKYRQEFLDAGDSMDGTGPMRRIADPMEWLSEIEKYRHPETVPANLVQATQFICVRTTDKRVVGMLQVRHTLNDYLEKYAGHIGYSVRPSERRKGYAKWMLRQGLDFCRQIGLQHVLISCKPENEGSRRTILANGGVYESTVFEPNRGIDLQRYWVDLTVTTQRQSVFSMSNKNLQKVNILLEGYDIDAKWLYRDLKDYIKPENTVAIIAFSFRDDLVKSLDDWNKLFSCDQGRYYGGIVNSLKAYGISEEHITFINYFDDSSESAVAKIKNADILYFTGGLPDKMMDRIKEFGIYDAILQHSGIFLGYSAGAVIQLKEYHLSPDKDYSEFSYYEGFPLLEDFYLEVHYCGTEMQNRSIKRVLAERKKPVYALEEFSGAIIVDNGKIKTIGNVKKFTPV